MGNPAIAIPFTTPVATWLATVVGDATYASLYSTAKFDRLVDDDGNAIPPVPASGVPANAGAIWANDVDDHVRATREVFRGTRPIKGLQLHAGDDADAAFLDWFAGAGAGVLRWQWLFDATSPQLTLRSYSAVGAFVRVLLTINEDDHPLPNLVTFARDAMARRMLTGGGTALTSGMITLGAGWGAGASVAVTAGSTAQRGRITITAAGVPAANPTTSIAIPDGVFPAGCTLFVRSNGGSGANHTIFSGQPTSTPLVLTHSLTPVAASTYSVDYGVQG